jgi:hypothetical protein
VSIRGPYSRSFAVIFAFLVLFLDLRSLGEVGRGYFGSLFCDLLLCFLRLFAAIPLCVLVPLCETLFVFLRVHSRFAFDREAFDILRSPFARSS